MSSSPWSGLVAGRTLHGDERLASKGGGYTFVMQGDGNLVAYDVTGKPYWSSYTQGHPGARLDMQGDGNLVVYDANGAALWHTATFGHPGAVFVLQDDGNGVVYGPDGTALWSIWQNTADRGSGFGQWLGRAEGTVGSIAASVGDIVRAAMPIIAIALNVVPGLGTVVSAAVIADLVDAGGVLATVDDTVSSIASQVQQGIDGFHAAVALLNQPGISPETITAVRDSLTSQADQASFDLAMANASAIGGNPQTVFAAGQSLAQSLAGVRPAHVAPVAVASSSAIEALTSVEQAKQAAAIAAAASPANELAILARAQGVTPAEYVAKQKQAAAPRIAAPAPGPMPAPKPDEFTTSGSSGPSGGAIALGLAAVGLLVFGLAARR